jgi:hypothetical protein
MWAKDKGGVEDDFRKDEFDPKLRVSSVLAGYEREGDVQRGRAKNLRILYAEKLLCKLACEFYQDPMRATIGVPEQGHDDVTVAELEER